MIISRSTTIAIVIVIISIITIITIRSKSKTSFPEGMINKKIYVGYIPLTKGGVSCEVNFTTNKVSTLSAGYGITEETPIDNGNTINNTFKCDFKEIVKEKSRLVSFTKNKTDFDIVLIKGGDPSKYANTTITPYRIHDIAHIYQIFTNPTDKPIVTHTSPNNKIYIGYVGISEEDEKNLIFFDIDYHNKAIYTITNQTPSIPTKGTYTGDLETSFKVTFDSSFLGENKEIEFNRLDFDTYNVTLTDSFIEFPLELLNITDIAKLYSLLVFRGAIALEFRRRVNLKKYTSGKKMGTGRKFRFGFPKVNTKQISQNFIKLYQTQKMAQLDFQNTVKSFEHNKKLLQQKLQQGK